MIEKKQLYRAILTAKELMATGRGIIAMDESIDTLHTRFAKAGIPQTVEMRRAWRELIVATPNLGAYLSGAILFEETIRQSASGGRGRSFIEMLETQGIVPGIKVDHGTVDFPQFPGEKVTEGIDGLRERLNEYAAMRLRFAKWRAVIHMGNGRPSEKVINTNVELLALYAAYCQEAGITPIVEPEVIIPPECTLEACFEVTERVQLALFSQLHKHRVELEGLILKPNMVLPGSAAAEKDNLERVADETVKCLLRTVPAVTTGIAFLSGGQDDILATARLNEINLVHETVLPWPVTFSYSRALQSAAMAIWKGLDANKEVAQEILATRAAFNAKAALGTYIIEEENGMQSN